MLLSHLLFSLVLAAPDAGKQPLPRLLVTPLEGRGGLPAGLADTLTEALAAQARKAGGFQVSTIRELEGVLTQQQRAQVVGCLGPCAVELSAVLHADQLLSGSVGRVGQEYVLNVVRVRVMDGETQGNAVRRVASAQETALLDVLPGLTSEVLGGRAQPDVIARSGGGVGTQVARAGPPAPGTVASRKIRLAVLPFVQRSKDPALEVLSTGLSDMVATDLAQCADLQVVEREQLRAVLGELRLQQDRAFDAASVQRLGKLLGVEYLVMGTYFVFGNTFRMDVKMVKVETAQHDVNQGVSGKVDDVMDLEKQLVLKMLEGVAANVRPPEKEQLERGRTGTLKDVVAYGNAVEALDRGDKATARSGALALLARLPGMAAARTLLARTEGDR